MMKSMQAVQPESSLSPPVGGRVRTFPSMKEIFEQKKGALPFPKIGDIIEGKIIGREIDRIFLDLGVLGVGIIYGQEFLDARAQLKDLKTVDKVAVKILDLENDDGFVELSLKEAGNEFVWRSLIQKKESGDNITVKIIGANRGGLLADMNGVQAFMPVSQLSFEHYPKVEGGDNEKIAQELRKFVGATMQVKIIDVDPREGKLIISEKAQDQDRLRETLKEYKVGNIVDGEVTGIVDFGVFMKFPVPAQDDEKAIEGLIHISELDWYLVANPADIVSVGQKIQAKIIDINNGKVFLSLKALKEDPWSSIESKFKKGDVIRGEVIKFNPFGAFIKLESGDSQERGPNPSALAVRDSGQADRRTSGTVQGLLHISEFGSRKNMEEQLRIGNKYNFKILFIDSKEHKISLGLASLEV